MSYIGRGIDQIDNISTLDNLSFNGSDATFNLTQNSVAFVPVSADALQIQIDGIIQSGNFSVSGSTVTFNFTPSGSSVCNGIKHFGVGVMTSVSDGAVTEAKIGSSAVTTAKINDGAVTSGKIASGVIPDAVSLRPNPKPLIINGDMKIAQRSSSHNSITGGGYYTVDRFDVNNAGAFIGTWTQTQESLGTGSAAFTTDGFAKSLKMDCTTANASPAANSQCRIDYKFEGFDVQLLKNGTAGAEKTTLSFWIKATKTGTNVVRMYTPDADRSCSQAYTVSTTNTWEKKVLNFPADTSGAVIANDNTMGLQVTFGIAMGSDNTSGTLATSWADNTKANDFVGQVNNADSTSNNWEITGVQLEVGEYTSSTIPDFQHEDYGDSLIRCQRYFQQYGSNNAIYNRTPVNGHAFLLGARDVGGNANWTYPVLYQSTPLRANPTISRNDLDFWSGGNAYGITGLGGNQYAGFNAIEAYVAGTTFADNIVLLKINGTQHTYLRFDSEL